MMKSILGLILALVAASSACAADAKRPNILLLLADDLGRKDVGYQGTDFHQTPNFDRLSKQGMIFPAAYGAAGNCQAIRAC